jgi:hypothetical protein
MLAPYPNFQVALMIFTYYVSILFYILIVAYGIWELPMYLIKVKEPGYILYSSLLKMPITRK